jgi:hypothetical protein
VEGEQMDGRMPARFEHEDVLSKGGRVEKGEVGGVRDRD